MYKYIMQALKYVVVSVNINLIDIKQVGYIILLVNRYSAEHIGHPVEEKGIK
jgi:hypothetical protein